MGWRGPRGSVGSIGTALWALAVLCRGAAHPALAFALGVPRSPRGFIPRVPGSAHPPGAEWVPRAGLGRLGAPQGLTAALDWGGGGRALDACSLLECSRSRSALCSRDGGGPAGTGLQGAPGTWRAASFLFPGCLLVEAAGGCLSPRLGSCRHWTGPLGSGASPASSLMHAPGWR